ncbi:hypothetical protein [Tepidibacter hydrothermalis]|uniref:Uncharacterized protein n=1 Tax=Tepidibacter hydrothermalis TaxID=3036126 RepID=A0ABY8EHP7_9FIRM|nr:hypothetical protein [Tepidibacter hydrothermalis]WFD12459.1 hypothetical protein P4S50_19970 [Tepidibacter hydrothermalis]
MYKKQLFIVSSFSAINAVFAISKFIDFTYLDIPTFFRTPFISFVLVLAHYLVGIKDDDKPPLSKNMKEINTLFIALNIFIAVISIDSLLLVWVP